MRILQKLPLKEVPSNQLFAPQLNITLYQLDTCRYISKTNHYLVITTGTVSLLVMAMGKAFNGVPPSLWGKQMVGPSSLPVVVAQSDERNASNA